MLHMSSGKMAALSAVTARRELILVVTGTRNGRDDTWDLLAWFCDTFGIPDRVILGCAAGVDTQARLFFESIGVVCAVHRAVWWSDTGDYRPHAGPERNQWMIDDAPEDAYLIALPDLGSKGTWDCLSRGRHKGLRCIPCLKGRNPVWDRAWLA